MCLFLNSYICYRLLIKCQMELMCPNENLYVFKKLNSNKHIKPITYKLCTYSPTSLFSSKFIDQYVILQVNTIDCCLNKLYSLNII